jgi:hypothetical protein
MKKPMHDEDQEPSYGDLVQRVVFAWAFAHLVTGGLLALLVWWYY